MAMGKQAWQDHFNKNCRGKSAGGIEDLPEFRELADLILNAPLREPCAFRCTGGLLIADNDNVELPAGALRVPVDGVSSKGGRNDHVPVCAEYNRIAIGHSSGAFVPCGEQ